MFLPYLLLRCILFDFSYILSQAREPRAVVPHLGKCFENIKDLEFAETSGGFPHITALLSADGEKVRLDEVYSLSFLYSVVVTNVPQGVRTSENVDAWLLDLESAMRTTLHSHIATSLAEYPSHTSDEVSADWEDWINKWEGQVVLAVSHIMWTASVSKALSVTGTPKLGCVNLFIDSDPLIAGGKGLVAHASILDAQLSCLLSQIRGPLPPLRRATLEVVVVSLVNSRDIVASLVSFIFFFLFISFQTSTFLRSMHCFD